MVARKSANRPKKYVTTRSGKQLKIHQSLGERYNSLREAKALRKVNRLRGLPKSRFKRIVWRLHPKRLWAYWVSRDGAIMALKISGLAILALFVITLGIFAYYRKYLPNLNDISGANLGGSISYYDRSGKVLLWQDYSGVKRVPVTSDNISKYVKEATIATEDRNFYNEHGFDVKGVIRATYVDAFHRGGVQGGSTITEQLVKLNLDWTQQRSISRKIKELILAVEMERTYTKDEILTGYLNAAPYGGVDYGVQAASSDYFHKSAKDLTLPESAMLAAIPKSPSVYSPYNTVNFDKDEFLARYDYVLDSMAHLGQITKAQATAAKKVDILAEVQPQQTKYAGIQAPYFVLAAKNELTTKFALNGSTPSGQKVGGWKVITTLDTNIQGIVDDRVSANYANVRANGGDEEASVVEDVPTGQIVGLVGGTDFNDPDHGHINYAQWPISPGSSIKPYDYSTLIQNSNAGAGSVLYDTVGPIPGYPCTDHALPPNGNCLWDYDRKSPGAMTLRYALGGSRNIPAVKATLSNTPGNTQASINKVDSTADAMMDGDVGYHCYKPGTDLAVATKSDQMDCTASSGIGDGGYLHLDQHLNGLSTLARMGQAIPATYILKVYSGTSSKPFYQWTQPKATQVLNPQTAYIMNNMLSDPAASYLSSGQKFQHYNGWDIGVKTGTTNDSFDGLMMAWSTKYAVGTWVGYHTRTQPLAGAMENLTLPVTRNVIEAALDSLHTQPSNWTQPAGIQTLPAYKSAMAYGTQGPAVSTDLFPSWYKTKTNNGQSQTIDKVSGKLATSCTPDSAKQTLSGSSAPNIWSVDLFYPPGQTASAGSINTNASDDVHSCSDALPSVDSFFVGGSDASGGQTVTCDQHCQIVATVSAGTHPFSDSTYPQYPGTVSLVVNGSIVQSQQVSDSPSTVTFTYDGSGSATFAIQVVDSVLYSTTTSPATVNFSAPVQSLNLSATTTSATWSGGTAGTTYTLIRTDNNHTLCTTTSTTCNYVVPHGTTLKLTDTSNDNPATVTV